MQTYLPPWLENWKIFQFSISENRKLEIDWTTSDNWMPRTVIPETKETIRGVIRLSWLPEAVCRQRKSKHIVEVLLNWRDRDQSLVRLRQHHLKKDFTFHIKLPLFLGHKSTHCGSFSQLSISVPFIFLSVITSLYVILISISLHRALW